MRFIDALYKYDEITRDDKEIYYYMNNIIYMRTEGLDEEEVAAPESFKSSEPRIPSREPAC